MLQKWMFTLVLFVSVLSLNAQFRKIPAVVTDAFKAKYAKATGVEWKDKLTAFEADFTSGDKEMKASFTTKGEWIKTESKFAYDDLPSNVKDGFKKSKYADLAPSEATLIDDKDKGALYKVVVKKNEYTKRNLLFTKTGQLVSDIGSL